MNFIKKVIRKIKEGMLQEMWEEAKWMWQYINRYKFAVFFYLILGVFSTLMGLGGSVLSKYLIDAVTGMDRNNIGIIVAGIIVMAIGGIVINAINSRISTKISIKVNNEIRQEAYNKVMTSDWLSMTNFHSGDILNRLNSDVSTVSSSVIGWIPNLITKLVQFMGALVIILYYDPTMALLALISAPIMIIVSKILMTKMRHFNKKTREVSSEVMAFNQESFQNIQSIKAFDLIDLFNKKLIHMQDRYKEVYLDFNKFSIATSSFMSLVGMVVTYSCFGWGVYRLWGGYITYGTMTLFLQMSSSLSSSFNALVGMVPSAISATTSARRLMDFFDLPNENLLDDEKIKYIDKNTKDKGLSVELSDVMFNYDENKVVFENANIVANPGEIVALVGPSGEGKTTMVRVLLGLVNIKKGKAMVRDVNGMECNISADSRKFFAYVPQGNTMFSGTVAENMRMVKEDATDEEIIQALKTACAYDFIKQLPDDINSMVGEKGIGFSEGQAQRLSIARALLRKSPILILDEATSALDVYTEREVLRNIMHMGYARTCIVTTHRPSVLNMCHRVYRIDKSRVSQVEFDEVERMVKNF